MFRTKGKLRNNKDSILLVVGISLCSFVFLITLIRASITGITYDESYTYIRIASRDLLDPKVLKSLYSGELKIANNHWLNSFLIFALDRISGEHYNEFIIRLPVLISFAIYLLLSCIGFKKKYYSFTTFMFLIGNYYLNEFYGLARGYSMANTFIFGICISYIEWKKSNFERTGYFNLLLICTLLAGFSNTIILLLYPGLFCICLLRAYKAKTLKQSIIKSNVVFLLWLVFSTLLLFYHFCISDTGMPLFTASSIYHSGSTDFFNCVIKGYVDMFSCKSLSAPISIVIIFLVLFSVIVLRKRVFENDFVLMAGLFFITCFIMELVFHKGYPIERVLLPFYTLIVLALAELFENTIKQFDFKHKSYLLMTLNIVLCMTICVIYICKTDIHKTTDWQSNYQHKDLEIGRYLTGQEYYTGNALEEQIFYELKYEEKIRKYREYLDNHPVRSFDPLD